MNDINDFFLFFFSQLDITSSLLLVTDNDFHNENFREQLVGTVNSLLASKVVPVFNENDAVSTRCAPYEVTRHTESILITAFEQGLQVVRSFHFSRIRQVSFGITTAWRRFWPKS